MKETMKKLLFELIKDSSRSDRKLAKGLGVSQATVSRMRNKLIKDGLIQEFTVKPDFVKLGYEIMAISVVKKKASISESTEKAVKWMKKYPNMIFAARAEGMGKLPARKRTRNRIRKIKSLFMTLNLKEPTQVCALP